MYLKFLRIFLCQKWSKAFVSRGQFHQHFTHTAFTHPKAQKRLMTLLYFLRFQDLHGHKLLKNVDETDSNFHCHWYAILCIGGCSLIIGSERFPFPLLRLWGELHVFLRRKRKAERTVYWSQFHQHFTSNFCEIILSPKNCKAKL